MSSTSYQMFGAPPRGGSNLYNQSYVPYMAGAGASPSGGLAGALNSNGGFQPTSNALAQVGLATATIKNPAQASQIGQGYQAFEKNRLADNASLTDFTKNYVASNPAARTSTDQEKSAVGGFYDGGVQRNFDRLADNSLAASNLAAQRAMGAANRQSALWRMQNGDSSYADKQLADQYGNIAIQNALRDAQQRQSNYQMVLSGQQGNLGVRNKLEDSYLNRLLVPGQQSTNLLNNQLSTLGALGGLDMANTSYGNALAPQPAPINPAMEAANAIAAKQRAAYEAYLAGPHGGASLVMPNSARYGPYSTPATTYIGGSYGPNGWTPTVPPQIPNYPSPTAPMYRY